MSRHGEQARDTTFRTGGGVGATSDDTKLVTEFYRGKSSAVGQATTVLEAWTKTPDVRNANAALVNRLIASANDFVGLLALANTAHQRSLTRPEFSKLKTPSGVDKSYSSGVNTVAALTALISGAQSASQTRLQSFRQATGSIVRSRALAMREGQDARYAAIARTINPETGRDVFIEALKNTRRLRLPKD